MKLEGTLFCRLFVTDPLEYEYKLLADLVCVDMPVIDAKLKGLRMSVIMMEKEVPPGIILGILVIVNVLFVIVHPTVVVVLAWSIEQVELL